MYHGVYNGKKSGLNNNKMCCVQLRVLQYWFVHLRVCIMHVTTLMSNSKFSQAVYPLHKPANARRVPLLVAADNVLLNETYCKIIMRLGYCLYPNCVFSSSFLTFHYEQCELTLISVVLDGWKYSRTSQGL